MSTHDKFRTFCASIQISRDNSATVSYRYKRITRQLNQDFWQSTSENSHSLYVGSYGRDTDIHLSDVDVLFILPRPLYTQYNNYLGNGQSALLQAVKSSIQKTYNSYMRADGQVVVIQFTDGITFEVVPCFENTDNSFTYPDTHSGGSWKVTKPREEISAIDMGNRVWNYNLKRLCRMARAWKDTWSVPIGGLLLDTLCYNFLSGWANRNQSYTFYDWMTRDFFDYLRNQNPDQAYWYAVGSGQFAYRRGSFEYKALRCYNISLDAIRHETVGQHYSANRYWREIYGTKFPA